MSERVDIGIAHRQLVHELECTLDHSADKCAKEYLRRALDELEHLRGVEAKARFVARLFEGSRSKPQEYAALDELRAALDAKVPQ